MLSEKDIPGFFAEESAVSGDHLLVDYFFETDIEPRVAAANLACEQSTVSWIDPATGKDLRPRFGAKVVSLRVVEKTLCHATIAHPVVNFGPKIPNLLTAVAGEGPFYCPGITSLKLTDLRFPSSFLSGFEGPRFGLAGLREKLKVVDRPFFVGVVKPNLGLTPRDHAARAKEAFLGGLDIVKYDEMLGDPPDAPLAERARFGGEARRSAERESGFSKLLLLNVTDESENIFRHAVACEKGGANALLINTFFTGYTALRALRAKSELPIMGHFTGQALFDRQPRFGISGNVLVKLQRLAGCDMIGIPGFGPRMKCPEEEVRKNIDACLSPMGQIKKSLPIPGGSDSAATLPDVCRKVGHPDFGFISGRGVFGHPDGPRAGAEGLVTAWESVRKGVFL